MNHDTVDRDRSDAPVFLHSDLDDAGLSVHAFRVYCHLARRANMTGRAWPGAASMAAITRLSENTVRKGIAELEARGMLRVTRSEGGRASNNYYLTARRDWIDEIASPSPREPLPFTSCTPPLHDVNPCPSPGEVEENPLRKSNEGATPAPPAAEGDLFGGMVNGEKDAKAVESIYAEYPRKKDRGHALPAIRRALKKIDADSLRRAVKSYAVHVTVEIAAGRLTMEKVPYPATWFHGERWTDQPDTKRTDHAPTRNNW